MPLSSVDVVSEDGSLKRGLLTIIARIFVIVRGEGNKF